MLKKNNINGRCVDGRDTFTYNLSKHEVPLASGRLSFEQVTGAFVTGCTLYTTYLNATSDGQQGPHALRFVRRRGKKTKMKGSHLAFENTSSLKNKADLKKQFL